MNHPEKVKRAESWKEWNADSPLMFLISGYHSTRKTLKRNQAFFVGIFFCKKAWSLNVIANVTRKELSQEIGYFSVKKVRFDTSWLFNFGSKTISTELRNCLERAKLDKNVRFCVSRICHLNTHSFISQTDESPSDRCFYMCIKTEICSWCFWDMEFSHFQLVQNPKEFMMANMFLKLKKNHSLIALNCLAEAFAQTGSKCNEITQTIAQCFSGFFVCKLKLIVRKVKCSISKAVFPPHSFPHLKTPEAGRYGSEFEKQTTSWYQFSFW